MVCPFWPLTPDMTRPLPSTQLSHSLEWFLFSGHIHCGPEGWWWRDENPSRSAVHPAPTTQFPRGLNPLFSQHSRSLCTLASCPHINRVSATVLANYNVLLTSNWIFFLPQFPGVKQVDCEPVERKTADTPILYIPWICPDKNKKQNIPVLCLANATN